MLVLFIYEAVRVLFVSAVRRYVFGNTGIVQPHTVLGELSDGTLSLAIYLKDGNTGQYLLKEGTINGSKVF